MKLSVTQIDLVYKFTLDHFVKYYDLQTELVDHLGNGIESQWIENPTISFDEALQNEFKKFGVFGFMDVVEKRQLALMKKYRRLIWVHFKDFFEVPKIAVTLFSTAILFFLLKNILFGEVAAIFLVLLATVFPFVAIIKNNQKKKRQVENKEQRWLFEEIIFSFGNIMVFISFPIQFLINFPKSAFQNDYILMLLSFLIVSYYLILFIMLKIIPGKVEQYLEETYPEYKFSK